jgi:hypothetical protein
LAEVSMDSRFREEVLEILIKKDISHMTLSEGKRAGITMYSDASFSIDAYKLEPFVPEKGWKDGCGWETRVRPAESWQPATNSCLR